MKSGFQIIKRVNHDTTPLDVRYDNSGMEKPSIIGHVLTIEFHSSDRAIDCKLLGEQLAQFVKLTRLD